MNESKVRKTKVLLGAALVAGLLALDGYAQQGSAPPASPTPKPAIAAPKPATPPPAPANPEPPDKVVLKVGDRSVTVGDLDYFVSSLPQQSQQAAKSAGKQALGENYATGLALEQQALADHLDQDPDFQRQLEFTRMQGLAKAEVQKLYGEITVSQDEISKYYAAHPDEFETVEVRRIVVRSKPGSSNPPAAGGDADAVKARLETIRKELAAGKDPAEISKEFKDAGEGFIDLKTQSARMAQLGPEWRDTVSKMKEGEVSEAHTVPDGAVALQVVKRSTLDLKAANNEIDQKVKNERLQARIEDLKKKAVVCMDGAYCTPAGTAPPPTVPKAAVGGVPGGGASAGVIGGIIGGVIGAAAPPPPPYPKAATPKRIRVGGTVEQARLVSQTKPEYPPLAKTARIQGTVKLEAVIDKDGTIEDLKVLSGHPLLVEAALDAVQHWRYQPTVLNGDPVEVVTEVDVNFSFDQPAPAPPPAPTTAAK
ncbi:MAG TPA: TonB family protein [Terriglobia bacterium]|nr:TonB family protein [Terriglobia bacterium]